MICSMVSQPQVRSGSSGGLRFGLGLVPTFILAISSTLLAAFCLRLRFKGVAEHPSLFLGHSVREGKQGTISCVENALGQIRLQATNPHPGKLTTGNTQMRALQRARQTSGRSVGRRSLSGHAPLGYSVKGTKTLNTLCAACTACATSRGAK